MLSIYSAHKNDDARENPAFQLQGVHGLALRRILLFRLPRRIVSETLFRHHSSETIEINTRKRGGRSHSFLTLFSPLRIFSLVRLSDFSLTCTMQGVNGVLQMRMRANHAHASGIFSMIGGSGGWGMGFPVTFSCDTRGACGTVIASVRVMGEMRVVICSWGRAWGEE